MGLSGTYGTANDEQFLKVIHRAIELGYSMLDTADLYGAGHNEELVGKAIRGHRKELFLATKFGLSGTSNSSGAMTSNGNPSYVREACEKSLKRLGVDHIDLYYFHRLDANTPIEDTVGAMARLVDEGKVRFLGLSEISPTTLKKAHKVHSISAVESEYSLWWTEPEQDILPICRELGVAFVAYAPLGRGMLTGKIVSETQFAQNDWRKASPRFQGIALERNKQLVKAVDAMASAKGVSVGQIALSWLINEGPQIFPIPGTKQIKYLEENWAALKVILSAADQQTLRSILAANPPEGARYTEKAQKLIDRTGRTDK